MDVCGRNAPTVTQAPQSRLADSGRPPAASLLGMPRPTRSRVWRFAVSCERVALRPPGRGRQLPLIPSSILFGRRCQARGLAALQPTLFRSRVHPRGRVGSAPLLAGNVRTSKKGRTAPCPLARLTRRCGAAEWVKHDVSASITGLGGGTGFSVRWRRFPAPIVSPFFEACFCFSRVMIGVLLRGIGVVFAGKPGNLAYAEPSAPPRNADHGDPRA